MVAALDGCEFDCLLGYVVLFQICCFRCAYLCVLFNLFNGYVDVVFACRFMVGCSSVYCLFRGLWFAVCCWVLLNDFVGFVLRALCWDDFLFGVVCDTTLMYLFICDMIFGKFLGG